MRTLRSVLTCIASVVWLAACGGDECSQPRTGDEETCDSYDGEQLSFVSGDPLPDVSAYCESRCVDVNAPIAIGGYDDLRKVPFLAKVRRLRNLGLNMDGLQDLRGLESVDVTGNLRLFGISGESSRKTLQGLLDDEVESLTIESVSGLSSLEGFSVKRAVSVSVFATSLERLDLSPLPTSFVSVHGNDELQSLRLPSGTIADLFVHGNSSLTELSWEPGLVVRNQIHVGSNTSLSSCVVQRLVDETDAGTHRTEFVLNNGPCP